MPYPNFSSDFLEDCSWFAYGRRDDVRIGTSEQSTNRFFKPSNDFITLFPNLTSLLSEATVTPLTLGDHTYLLFGWRTRDGGTSGWLCEPAAPTCARTDFHPH